MTSSDLRRPPKPVLLQRWLCFGWAGEGRRIREALPHFDRIESIEALRLVLTLLGYGTTQRSVRQSEIADEAMPCLFSRDGSDVMLIVERERDGTLLVFDGSSASWKKLTPTNQLGSAFYIWNRLSKEESPEEGKSWLLSAVKRFKPAIVAMLAFSFLGNIAALTLPIFVICVYDLGIGTRSTNTVVMLAVGAGIVIATNLALRSIRARMMAYFGARIDSLISMKSFDVILNMPVSMIESAPIGTQVSRLKQFESMRDFFTGTLASSIVDIPFIFIFLIAIAIWGGHLVWVPISLISDLCRARCNHNSDDAQLRARNRLRETTATPFVARAFQQTPRNSGAQCRRHLDRSPSTSCKSDRSPESSSAADSTISSKIWARCWLAWPALQRLGSAPFRSSAVR